MTVRRPRKRQYYLPLGCIIPVVLVCVLLVGGLVSLPLIVERTYGPASENLGIGISAIIAPSLSPVSVMTPNRSIT